MLIVSGTLTVDPGEHDRALDAVGPVVEATLAEDGNITYGFWAHPTERGRFRIYEEWKDADALDRHLTTPHMAEFIAAMGTLSVTSTEVHRHEVSASSRIM